VRAADHAAAQEPAGRSCTSPPLPMQIGHCARCWCEPCSRRSAGDSGHMGMAPGMAAPAWLVLSERSCLARTGEVAAPSRMEQSVDVGAVMSLLVLCARLLGCRRTLAVRNAARAALAISRERSGRTRGLPSSQERQFAGGRELFRR